SSAGHALLFGHLDDPYGRTDYEVIFAPFGMRGGGDADDNADIASDEGGETAYAALARKRAQYEHDVHDIRLAKTASVTVYPSAWPPRTRGAVPPRSADPDDKPVISHELVGEAADLHTLVRACQAVRNVFAQPAIARYVVGEELPGQQVRTDDEWREFLHG